MTNPTPDPTGAPPSLEERLATAERMLGTLAAELSALRADVRGASRPAEEPASAPPPPRPRPEPRHIPPPPRKVASSLPAVDFEQLIGRYGILAIAVVAAVAAVGTFLSWAISRGYLTLGPGARVAIGLAASAALGAWGIRMRRTERSFGSTILGLALVIVMVCAYGAGPKFHLVPPMVAFAGAAFVSWTLALFAHAENDEPLWCVGFGGAALAPFVTSDGGGNEYLLLSYGLLVLLPACFAISHRDWPVAWRVFYVVAAVYTFSGATLARGLGGLPFAAAFAFPFVLMIAGVVPFAPDSRKRGTMRWLAVLAVIAGLASHASSDAERMLAMAGFLAAATVWLGLIDRHAAVEQSTMVDDWRARIAQLDWIDAAILPLLFVAEGGEIAARSAYVAYAVAAVLFIAFAWRRAANSLRDAAAAGAIASAVFAIAEYAPERPLLFVSLLTAVAIGSLAANVQRKSASWIVGCIAVLLLGGTMTLDALATRPIYQFTPFATEASLAALIVTLGFAALGRFAYPLAPWIWGFVWGLFELAMAFSPSTSTLLLVVYFAATGVVCVAAGRARQSARLRQTGLALALIAAGTAFYGASTYFDSGVRIVAYLVTSAFLLGIAYWYRRPGSAESPAATA